MGKVMEKVKSWWISLTPDRRKMAMGAGCLAVLLGVMYLFVSAGPKQQQASSSEAKADLNLLTGSDVRTLGIEALGAELKSTQRNQRMLEAQLAKLQQDTSTRKDLERVSADINALTQGLGTLKDEAIRYAAELEQTKRESSMAADVPAGKSRATNAAEAQRQGLFDYPSDYSGSPPQSASGDAFGRTGKPPAMEAGEPIKVRVYGEGEPQAANSSKATSDLNRDSELYIPAGSILSGVLLTGVDAPTGMQSKRDPVPVLMRVKHEAILPNRFRSDVRECFVVFGTTGDLSTERALMRAETLSCIRRDGGVIETAIDAYAMGDDGKAGIRGRLVSRNGSLVAKAAFASFAEALSQVFRPVAVQGFNTSPGNRTQFQAPDPSEALEASGYAGFGGAMRRLSEYFVDLADEIVPFIEVDAARQIEAVMLKGVTLKVRGAAA